MLQTITKTSTKQVKVCTNESAFAVLVNAQNLVCSCVLEQDPTASAYFVQVANIYRDLCKVYYKHVEQDLVPVAQICNAIAKHLTYVEESALFADLLENTDLATESVDNYTYLSN